VPVRMDDASQGGNATCATIGSDVTLSSSGRHDWRGGRLRGDLPDGLDVIVAGDTEVAWTSTFRMSAVIVKAGSAANVYLYDPTRLSDGGLVAPVNASGKPAELSNLTFCWDASTPPPPEDDLELMCMTAATAADVGPIVSVAGPIEVRNGLVVTSTMPSDVLLTYDAVTQRVAFSAPFPVVVAVTRSSPVSVHHIDPMVTSGSVPLASEAGSGDVVLCGLAPQTVVQMSCAMVQATAEVGPIPIRGGVIAPDAIPPVITRLEVKEDALEFEALVPIIGVLVSASPTVLHAFDEPVLAASLPLVVQETPDADLVFCLRTTSIVTHGGPPGGSSSTSDTVEVLALDPVMIASGGGPSTRATVALLAFLVLSLVGVSAMALWSRSD
jgi:hypothetical protein